MSKKGGWYRFGQVAGIVIGVIVGHTIITAIFGPRYGNYQNHPPNMSQNNYSMNNNQGGVFDQAIAMSYQNNNQRVNSIQ